MTRGDSTRPCAEGLTRREFVASVTGTAMAGATAMSALLAPGLRAEGAPDAFPFLALVDEFSARERRHATAVKATGLSRDGYVAVIEGIARFFSSHQDARGAIIDPYEHKERQYSTPAFALAVAVLAQSGRDRSLLPAAARAMEAACGDLASGKTADAHADFFTVLLLHADRLLGRLVPAGAADAWRASLRQVVPEKAYRFQPTAATLNNWNLVAAAGEWLRTSDGYGKSLDWIDTSVAKQEAHFTPAGMYRDPNDPLAYDHFARLWALDLVEEGYRGADAARLDAWLERAAWMSLFMQSPHGEMPCGGRSAHHQWNEAQQAVTCETFARRFARRGNAVAAGAFKRAARLSLQSVGRWVRPSGELWIVKNRLDPALRHGYEVYSFHSQYNLLAAAMLAIAWLRADDSIAERACPADAGGYAFALQPAFHKVFLAARGYHVEIDTGADPHYNPTGILRVHHRSVPSALLSDGVVPAPAYTVTSKPTRALAFGLEWRDAAGTWHSLAAHGLEDLEPTAVRILRSDPDAVGAELRYAGRLRGGATAVREHVHVSARGVDVEHTVEGEVVAVRQSVPFLLDDGRGESRVTVGESAAAIERDGGRLRVRADGASVARAGLREACRNGFMDALLVAGNGRTSRSVWLVD
jgi:hypothetical protein